MSILDLLGQTVGRRYMKLSQVEAEGTKIQKLVKPTKLEESSDIKELVKIRKLLTKIVKLLEVKT